MILEESTGTSSEAHVGSLCKQTSILLTAHFQQFKNQSRWILVD